jgi:uncharacterized protein (TIGR02246 family)
MPAKTSIMLPSSRFFAIRSARERPLVLKVVAQSASVRETSSFVAVERLVALEPAARFTIKCFRVGTRQERCSGQNGANRPLSREVFGTVPCRSHRWGGRLLGNSGGVPMVFRPVLVLSVLAVAALHAQAPTSPLLELTKAYLATAKARDAAKVASFYAEDAVMMPPNAPPVTGRKAIQQDHERLFKESPSFELTATPLASETSGDLGYIQGEFVVKQRGPTGEATEVRGKYVEVWKRIKGEWKILYDINNANHPPRAPTPPTPPTPPMPPTPPQE